MEDEFGLLHFVDADVQCHTDGCDNNGKVIRLSVVEDPEYRNVMCGLCGNTLTDVVAVAH